MDHAPRLDEIINHPGVLHLRYTRHYPGGVEAEITMAKPRDAEGCDLRTENGFGDLPEEAVRVAFAKFFSTSP